MEQLDSTLTIKDNYASSFISPPKGSDFSELERYKNKKEKNMKKRQLLKWILFAILMIIANGAAVKLISRNTEMAALLMAAVTLISIAPIMRRW